MRRPTRNRSAMEKHIINVSVVVYTCGEVVELNARFSYQGYLGATAPSGPGPPHDRGFTITLGRAPLDKRSAQSRDLYLTTHNIHNRQISMTQAGFEPQSQQASGHRPTPQTALPLGSVRAEIIEPQKKCLHYKLTFWQTLVELNEIYYQNVSLVLIQLQGSDIANKQIHFRLTYFIII